MNAVEKVFSVNELLEMIFSFTDFADLKSARAVCRSWREAAKVQIKERAHIDLGIEKDGSRQLARLICATNRNQFMKFTVPKKIPKSFEMKFSNSLTALHLQDVTFSSMNHFRLVVFEVFQSMTELALLDPKLRSRSLDGGTYRSANNTPKVRKLTIRQGDTFPRDRHIETDLFLDASIEELVRNYRATLKEVHCPYMNVSCKKRMRDFFSVLLEQRVQLTDLNFCFNRAAEIVSFQDYVKAFGEKLKSIELSGLASFNRVFTNLAVSNIRLIRDTANNWEHWKGEELTSLTELDVGIIQVESFNFLRKMPNLKILHMGLYNEQVLWEGGVSPSVLTLKLQFFGECEPLTRLSKVFPNLRRVEIEVSHETYIHTSGQCPLQNVANVWPRLEHVKLLGHFHACLSHNESGLELIRGKYNLNLPRQLLKFKNLRSFVCNDEYSEKIHWDDYMATAIFMKLPQLEILRIGTCAMSDSVVDQLRENLLVFTYLKRSEAIYA